MTDGKTENKIAAPELTFRKYKYSHPTYRYHKVLPMVNPNITVQPSTTVTSTLTLPTNVLANFKESYIQFDWSYRFEEKTCPKVWADTYGLINSISLQDPSQTVIGKCEYLQNYVKVVGKKSMTVSEMLTRDRDLQPIHPNNSLIGDPGAIRPEFAVGGDDIKSNVAYFEPQYIKAEAEVNGTALAPVVKRYSCRLMLADLKDAGVFSTPHDIPLLQNYTMDITFGKGNKAFFTSTSQADPDTGAANPVRDIAVTNLKLMLAIEDNQDVIDEVNAKVKSSGFSIWIPFLSAFRYPHHQSEDQSVTQIITTREGRRLQKVIHSVFNTDETKNHAYDCNNINGSKIISYQTTLGDKDRQKDVVDCKNHYDDYMVNKRFIQSSAMLNRNVYQYNWFHCDDFTELPNPGDNPLPVPAENCEAGVPITKETPLIWRTAMKTANSALSHYYWIVGQKLLTITPSQVTCD